MEDQVGEVGDMGDVVDEKQWESDDEGGDREQEESTDDKTNNPNTGDTDPELVLYIHSIYVSLSRFL